MTDSVSGLWPGAAPRQSCAGARTTISRYPPNCPIPCAHGEPPDSQTTWAYESDRSYYRHVGSEVEERLRAELREAADRSAELHRQSRALLVGAVRKGAAAGMSQRQIAELVSRSQPEVARLLRFQPRSTRGRAVAAKRGEVLRIAREAGFTNIRIFGSVARGEDGPQSDVDLLVTAPTDVSLLDLARLERSLSDVVGEKVEIVPDSRLRSSVRETAIAEAIPL